MSTIVEDLDAFTVMDLCGEAVGISTLFDALAGYAGYAPRRHFEQYFEVVAGPGDAWPNTVQPGDLVLSRAFAEGGLAYAERTEPVPNPRTGHPIGRYAGPTAARRVPHNRLFVRRRRQRVVDDGGQALPATDATTIVASRLQDIGTTMLGSEIVPAVRLGSHGETVRRLQRALGTHGLDLAPDGKFGPQTHLAVRLFQRMHYLKPDGIVGPLTWSALRNPPYLSARTSEAIDLPEQTPLQRVLPADFEILSWVFPHTKGNPGLLGQIFFPTNQVDLDLKDKRALDRLIDIVAAQTTSYFAGDPNKPLVMLPGHADPRPTTRPGGNDKLSIDRSASVLAYLKSELDKRDAAKGNAPGTWKGKVAFQSYGVGVDPALKALAPGYPFMRMVALVRTRGDDFVVRDAPANSCAEAKARARKVLRTNTSAFLPEEFRRLTHMCKDATTEDGFLKIDDPQFVKEVHGASTKLWSEAELDAFMNRHRFCTHLKRFAGSTVSDKDVIGVLRHLHGTMAAAIFEMHKAQIIADATKDYAPVPNQHRKQLINRVADQTRNPRSVYFQFGLVSGP